MDVYLGSDEADNGDMDDYLGSEDDNDCDY